MNKLNKLYIIGVVMFLCVGCDQITKSIAKEELQMALPKSYAGDTFRLQYAENTGAFLSLGAGLPKAVRTWLFTFLSGALLIGLLGYMLVSQEMGKSHIVALSMILGGGFSNLVDRMLHDGRVVDFMNMGIGSLRTGIFNFADVLIMVGMGLILLFSFQLRKSHTHTDDASAADVAQDSN